MATVAGSRTAPSGRPADADPAAWAAYYDAVYAAAGEKVELVPWCARGGATLALIEWLTEVGQTLLKPGCSAIVVGCGPADDVSEMLCRGYEVIGLDRCPRAVAWAQSRHPQLCGKVIEGDMTCPPGGLCRRFELVVDIGTLESLPPESREAGAKGLVALARPRGVVLVVGQEDAEHPLEAAQLIGLMGEAGMAPIGEVAGSPVVGTFARAR